MQLEIESKILVGSLKEVEKAILEEGAVFQGEYTQEDVYYNHPSRDFTETDEALRVRKQNGTTIVTYKGKRFDRVTKTRSEINLVVDGDASGLFEVLGFRPAGRVKKRRKEYIIGEVKVCLDDVEGLGHYVELEALGTDYKLGKAKIFEIMKKINFIDIERKSYLELLTDSSAYRR